MSKKIIKRLLNEGLNNVWYHGTPDVRNLEKEGGFSSRTISVDYISDLTQYYELQNKIKVSRESGDEDAYFRYLDLVPKLKAQFKMRKPVFLTNVRSIAKTYANPRRSMDYQGAEEKVLTTHLNDGKVVTIVATGDRFRFIDVNKVIRGFVSAGVPEDDVNKAIKQFSYYQNNDKGLKTDVVAVIGEWFGFDYIDVVGVLDAYEGGNVKSTVRMVFDPKNIKIMNNERY